jgi:addiction module HigA family antidote
MTAHPGNTLREMLADLRISQADVARQTGYTTKHISQVVNGRAPITADLAYALSSELNLNGRDLLKAQAEHDYDVVYQLAQSEIEETAVADKTTDTNTQEQPEEGNEHGGDMWRRSLENAEADNARRP